MTNLVFIDTETTSLRPDRRAWDIGLIVRDKDGVEAEHQWYVLEQDLDLGNADAIAWRMPLDAGQPAPDAARALVEAVDELPHIGETEEASGA